MKPELQVHSYDESEAGNPVAIKELTNWLTSTATLKVSDLEQQVKKFHYVTCTDRQRLELLDWIRPLLTNTAYSVRAAIDDGKLPLPSHVLENIDGLGRIYATMADLYKATILSLASKVLQNSHDSYTHSAALHEDLILACYGAINFLAEELRAYYEGYRPISEGTWHEIHHIYNYARYIIGISKDTGVDEEKTRDEFFLIEHVYKRSLLLGLCNPYHFPVSSFGELNRTLNKWAHLCKIDHQSHVAEQTCMFSIDAESDYPAVPVLSHSGELATSEQFAVLDTKELVAALNNEIDAMALQAFSRQVKDPSDRSLLQIEMYRRLVMNWGKHPVRQDVRHENQGKCESVAGYNEIMTKMGGMLVSALKKEPLDEERCCTITDASQMGYQVEINPNSSTRIRVGDMVAVRNENDLDLWALAVVRWARYTPSRRIRVGMFIMGRQAERHKLQVDLSSDQTIDVMSVVGVSNFPSDKKILLVPTGTYHPGKVMELFGGENHRIIAGNLLMSGMDFDVMDYKLLS